MKNKYWVSYFFLFITFILIVAIILFMFFYKVERKHYFTLQSKDGYWVTLVNKNNLIEYQQNIYIDYDNSLITAKYIDTKVFDQNNYIVKYELNFFKSIIDKTKILKAFIKIDFLNLIDIIKN